MWHTTSLMSYTSFYALGAIALKEVISRLSPEERVGAGQAKSIGEVFLVEGAAWAKAWSADIARHVPEDQSCWSREEEREDGWGRWAADRL